MRRLLSLIFTALLGVGVAACGSAGKTTPSVSASASPASSKGSEAPARSATSGSSEAGATNRRVAIEKAAWVRRAAQPPLPNDGDHDEPGERSPRTIYHDADDQAPLEWGHPASAHDRQALTAVVKTYYAAATEGNGAKACSTMSPPYARVIPVTYAKLGPPYLHGAKTCAQVLSLLFKHLHRELTAPVHVTDVRVSGNKAFVFFGSKVMPASQISIRLINGKWEMLHLIGIPML